MREPKRERTLYEIASIFFAQVVIAFAFVGMVVTGLGVDGPASSGFLICAAFLLLGLGRLYLGLAGQRGCRRLGRLAEGEPDHQRQRQRGE